MPHTVGKTLIIKKRPPLVGRNPNEFEKCLPRLGETLTSSKKMPPMVGRNLNNLKNASRGRAKLKRIKKIPPNVGRNFNEFEKKMPPMVGRNFTRKTLYLCLFSTPLKSRRYFNRLFQGSQERAISLEL